MATTNTIAATRTRTRITELKVQFGIALRRLSDMSVPAIDRLLRGLDERWIAEVLLYAVDATGAARGCFVLKVDWATHVAELCAGRAYVDVDERVVIDQALPEVHYPLEFFQTYAREKVLAVRVFVHFTPEVNRDPNALAHARRELGLVPGTAPRWAGQPEERWRTPAELPELRIGYQFLP